MTLARIAAHPHFDTATEYLDLTATLLRSCRTFFLDSAVTMDLATAAVAELEARAARPGHPAAGLARRWRTGTLFALARELRDGLAGVRLMVESAAVATGNAAGALGCCETAPEEVAVHDSARDLARRAVRAHYGFVALTGRLDRARHDLQGPAGRAVVGAGPADRRDVAAQGGQRRPCAGAAGAGDRREPAAGGPGRGHQDIKRGPHAPVRARLSLLPSGPGEVHEMNAAWGPWSL